MLDILYVSNLCSEKVLDSVFNDAKKKPGQAVQKFHRLLASGLAMHKKNCTIGTITTIPVVPGNNKVYWNFPSERINDLEYKYIPILNLPFIKNFGVFVYTFIKVIVWSLNKREKASKLVISDILNLTVSTASFLACKITNTKNITIVTDVPGIMAAEFGNEKSNGRNFLVKVILKMLTRYDGYILLTEQMNHIVNPLNRPYIIMEGLVDINMKDVDNTLEGKNEDLILIYAGGLYEKYGIKTLIEAFKKLKNINVRLHLYGGGDMVSQIIKQSEIDHRIIYKGIVPNREVVIDQLKATLMINPRPTNGEFTKYSFPSKNMEYMVSGTPIVTTNLAGMPKEYYNYVYLFENEDEEAMYQTIQKILSKSRTELHNFGSSSKEFVLKNKNNYEQAKRVLNLIEMKLF